MEDRIEQKFCEDCGGMLRLTINGKIISQKDWTKHGFAYDMNCVCDNVEVYEDFDDSMDGDFDSGMASAGMGTDEDYNHYGMDDEL